MVLISIIVGVATGFEEIGKSCSRELTCDVVKQISDEVGNPQGFNVNVFINEAAKFVDKDCLDYALTRLYGRIIPRYIGTVPASIRNNETKFDLVAGHHWSL